MTEPPTPRPYKIRDRPLVCPHCENTTFYTRRSLLNTRGLAFLNWDWLNKDAMNFICAACGHLDWFVELTPGGP